MKQHSISESEEMHRAEEMDCAVRRLRVVLMLPLLWIVLAVNLPDVIMGLLNIKSKSFNSMSDVSAILIMGAALLYLLFTIKQEKKVTRLLSAGVVLVVLSQTTRIMRILGFYDGLQGAHPFDWYSLIKVVDEACNGLGLVLIAAAFLNAIVDLFAAKQRLIRQQDDLSREIIRRTAVEKEILEEKQKYEDLLKNLPVAVYRNTPGPEGHFLEVNPAHVAMLEADSQEDLLKINVSDLYRSASERKKVADKLMRQGFIKNEEVELVTLKGKPIIGSATAVLKYDACGQPYFDGIIEDITDRVVAQRLLEEQRAKLVESARLASLGIMAGGIAHEIYNPLAVIAGCAERLEDHAAHLPGADDFLRKYLHMIHENADQIQKIIQGLRSISRDASNDPFIRISLETTLENIVAVCKERFLDYQIAFDIDLPPAALFIECRPAQIGQVLINLLNNAFDAVQGLPQKWIRLAATGRDEEVEIVVEDNGPGFPEGVAEKAFIPFFTTKPEGSGIGLGLSISRRIIEAHHGGIVFEVYEGHTRFTVKLPYTQPPGEADV